jgi:hypothetical protein
MVAFIRQQVYKPEYKSVESIGPMKVEASGATKAARSA